MHVRDALPRRLIGSIAAGLILSACATSANQVTAVSSSRNEVQTALARSHADQPVLVSKCPEGGTAMPQGSLIQADMLGRDGAEKTFIVIGDAAPEKTYSYDINKDGIPEAWCGEVSDQRNAETGLYEPSRLRTDNAHLVIPNWEGCAIPTQVGERFECTGSPLVWIPDSVAAGTPVPTTTIA